MAETAKTTLPKAIFNVNVPNHELVKLAYDSYLANSRTSAAKTKKRGEVSGGGKKPWQQKGTGRARFGSSRNPIWRSGGIAFGPTGDENYSKKLSKTSKHVAIKQALTLANQSKKIVTLSFADKMTGKTKDTAEFLKKNKLSRKVLLVVNEKTPELIRSTNNVENVIVVRATYLNVYNILNADNIVIDNKAIPAIEAWLTKEDA